MPRIVRAEIRFLNTPFFCSLVPSPAVAAQELVAHGQIRVQDRANLRRARGVECPQIYPSFSDGYVMALVPIATLRRHK